MSTGSGHLLWPEGTTVETAPADFVSALNHAIRINQWQENLPSDETPPRWMWHLDWELEDFFLDLDAKRQQKYGSAEESTAMEENEYASRFKSK